MLDGLLVSFSNNVFNLEKVSYSELMTLLSILLCNSPWFSEEKPNYYEMTTTLLVDLGITFPIRLSPVAIDPVRSQAHDKPKTVCCRHLCSLCVLRLQRSWLLHECPT